MIDMLAVQQIVKEAAKLFANREEVNRIKEKGAYDFVTAVDEAVQNFISQELQKLYPKIQFLGEEGDNADVDLNGLLWVLDPVDGTTNLIHDYKNSAISLALIENREPIAGIIYDPYLDEMYWAKKGEGSFLNGEKISVSAAKTMS